MKNKTRLFAILGILCVGIIGIALFTRMPGDSGRIIPETPAIKTSEAANADRDDGRPAVRGNDVANDPEDMASRKELSTKVPMVTKRSDRSAPVDRSKLPVTDMAKSSGEQSPWPDGPRLYLDIATESRRLVNMRPNIIGLLPKVQVAPGEILTLNFNAPDSSGDDTIYVELADGGSFPEHDKVTGLKVTLGSNKSAELKIAADTNRGNCTVLIRQAGHSRTLPIWVGALPQLAEGDADR